MEEGFTGGFLWECECALVVAKSLRGEYRFWGTKEQKWRKKMSGLKAARGDKKIWGGELARIRMTRDELKGIRRSINLLGSGTELGGDVMWIKGKFLPLGGRWGKGKVEGVVRRECYRGRLRGGKKGTRF